MSEEFRDAHYRAREGVWHGRANAVLADVVGSLPPGTALEHGSAAPWSWNQDALFPTPEESPAERLAAPQREATGPSGQTATVADIVIAIRRG